MLSIFKVDGRQHTVSGMFAFRVIEHFDVVEDVLSGLLAGLVGTATNAFTFDDLPPEAPSFITRVCGF